jgi:hypothetical protein
MDILNIKFQLNGWTRHIIMYASISHTLRKRIIKLLVAVFSLIWFPSAAYETLLFTTDSSLLGCDIMSLGIYRRLGFILVKRLITDRLSPKMKTERLARFYHIPVEWELQQHRHDNRNLHVTEYSCSFEHLCPFR